MGEPRQERAEHQQPAEDERHDVELRHRRAASLVCIGSHTGGSGELVRITVLGKSPAWQDADGACSGYLVEGGGQTVLLDCGAGVFAKLRRFVDYVDVDAVVISHLHADHILDLVPFASGAALRAAPAARPGRRASRDHEPARPRLIAPPGALEAFAGMCAATGMTADHIEVAFDVTIYDPGDTVDARRRCGALPAASRTSSPATPSRSSADGAGRFTFSADCAPNDELCDVRRRHRPAADRGDAAAARARRPPRAPHAARRRASTAPGRTRSGWS